MSARKRVLFLGALVAGVAIGAVLIDREPAKKAVEGYEESAGLCQGSLVELEFDPEGHIEARANGEIVATADVTGRDVNHEVCAKARSPHAFNMREIRFTRLKTKTTVTCRFPGRFVVRVHPVSFSWSGELPAGTAVALVRRITRNPPQQTIYASATVAERPEYSTLSFVRRFCTPS